MSIITLPSFDADNPLDEAQVTQALQLIAGVVNGLAGEATLKVGSAPSNPNPDYVAQTGGNFLGQITASSVLVGPPSGTQYAVVTKNDLATSSAAGIAKAAAALADLNQTISGSYTQAEVQAISDKVDALLAALRTAGVLET